MYTNKPTEISIAYVMLNESILLEDRLQYLKDNTKKLSTDHDTTGTHKETADIVQHLADHGDPTKNKQHTQFAVGLYRSKAIRQEDAPRLKEALSNFDKYKGKLNPEEKQLTTKNYPSISHIEDKIAPHLGTMASKKEAQKTLEQPGHKLVHEDDKIKIFHLSDKEASKNIYGGGHQRGGTGTSWCTAARSDDNMFDHYAKQGKMHVVHRKSDGAVFQYHADSNQFMDHKDNEISHEDFKSIAPSLHKAWKEKPELIG
jgi:hypothetical protein